MTGRYVRQTDTVPIDKGIPIPPNNFAERQRSAPRFPWDEMEVGDSFFSRYHGAYTNTSKAARRYPGKKFTGRSLEDGGWRIWRTE